jgi:hypothetical protein
MDKQVDPNAVLDEAVELAKNGFHAEALQRHLWFHQHALEFSPALCGVRLSFALTYWVDLGNHYPPALDAIKAIRDAKVDELAQGGGSRHSFHDIVAINDHIDDAAGTAELFRLLDARYPELAKGCYSSAEQALAGAREYQLCERYVSDLDARLEAMRSKREKLMRFHEESDRRLPPEILRIPDILFAKEVGQLVEILHGAGRIEEATCVRDWALAISNGPEVRDVLGIPQSLP